MEEYSSPSIFDDVAQEANYQPATQGQRFANYIIDTLVYLAFHFAMIILIGIFLAILGKSGDEISGIFSNGIFPYFLAFVDMVIIYTLIEGVTKGRSLGKLITKTRAVSENSSNITWKQALIRSLSRAVPFEPFSALGNTPWHDKWSKTMVIKNRQQV